MNAHLTKDEILGRKIVQLHTRCKELADDLISTTSWLTLDNGACFVLPLGFNPFVHSAIPQEARRAGLQSFDKIAHCAIKAVHVQTDGADDVSDGLLVELESGLYVFDVAVAPKGIPTGLFWRSGDVIDLSDYRDYWEWRETHPAEG